MKRSCPKPIPARTTGIVWLMLFLFTAGAVLAQSGRPKVLVLRPQSTIEDEDVISDFQWKMAEKLDKSGKFDIVKKDVYQGYLDSRGLDEEQPVPDSMVSSMVENLGVTIYATGTLEQPGGEDTPVTALIDFYIPKNDFKIDGKEVQVENQDKMDDLAEKSIEPLMIASERISLYAIARSYFNSAIYDKAIENYKKLLEITPEDLNVHYMIGLSHLKAGQKQEALAKFEEILAEHDPAHKPTLEILATTHFSDQNFEQALKYYKKLAELEPSNYEYNRYLAFSLQKLGREAEAMDVYEHLIGIKDQDASIRNMLGYFYYTRADSMLKAGDTTAAQVPAEKAVTNMQRCVELSAENPDSANQQWVKSHSDRLNLLGLAQMKAAQYDKAIDTFNELVELNADYPNVYYFMGQCCESDEDFRRAAEYFSQAAEKAASAQTKGALYQKAGRIYDKQLNNLSQAIDAYTKSLQHLNGDAANTVRFLRGLAYHDMGNQLDYSADESADVDALIQAEKMTSDRAERALSLYDKAEQDLSQVDGRYAKNATDFIGRITQLRDRLEKIKTQIAYYEKTK